MRDVATFADIAEQTSDHSRMVHRTNLAKIGQAADGPQATGLRGGSRRNGRILGNDLQDGKINCLGSRPKYRVVASFFEASDQRLHITEVEVRIAPVKKIERPKP